MESEANNIWRATGSLFPVIKNHTSVGKIKYLPDLGGAAGKKHTLRDFQIKSLSIYYCKSSCDFGRELNWIRNIPNRIYIIRLVN